MSVSPGSPVPDSQDLIHRLVCFYLAFVFGKLNTGLQIKLFP